jgi:hypothetical protein
VHNKSPLHGSDTYAATHKVDSNPHRFCTLTVAARLESGIAQVMKSKLVMVAWGL